jgi:hypothetical protein
MENILENNRLIAEFMGLKKDNPNTNWFYNAESGKYFRENELEYHQKWGWIMPVVKKISHLYDFFNIENDLKDLRINANINDVYSACLSFIKHYNNQN